MTAIDWIETLRERLAAEEIPAGVPDTQALHPARRLTVDAAAWGDAARIAAGLGARWAGMWGDPMTETLVLRSCMVRDGIYLVLECEAPNRDPAVPSQTPHFPAANRLERHCRDLLGVTFTDHPDARRWTRHKAWPDGDFPLRWDYALAGSQRDRSPADSDYPFERVQGHGVHEIPVGPVHAGIIEPGHFRFQAEGEEVLRLEARLGYTHKGIEKVAVGLFPKDLARLAGRVSGDSTVAHAWAACQAMERAAGCEPPSRALHLRALLAERERIANHLGDIGAICNDVGFAFAHVQCARLRETWQRRNREIFGHRLLMDTVVPGGVSRDLPSGADATLREDHEALRRVIHPLFDIVDDHASLEDRLLGTGRLDTLDARFMGCTGYVAKASGVNVDVRRDSPYAPYERFNVENATQTEGDVAARVRVRMAEVNISLGLIEQLLDSLPDGAVTRAMPTAATNADGLGIVEGWRGEIVTYVRFGEAGSIARFHPRDPSWFTWPALERLIHGNIVPDFPVCNKSVNASYSGVDL
ncbi:MAG: NADH-quinone oxidoreductase subunit C [Ectothiorhodospiraceae bacterium]|jgi:Ni,Fe-hydrogenase III large subunit